MCQARLQDGICNMYGWCIASAITCLGSNSAGNDESDMRKLTSNNHPNYMQDATNIGTHNFIIVCRATDFLWADLSNKKTFHIIIIIIIIFTIILAASGAWLSTSNLHDAI
eukprot:5668999-Amphidinium_carterae.1